MKRPKSDAAAPAAGLSAWVAGPGPNKKAKAIHTGPQQAPPGSSTTVQQHQLPVHSKDGPDAAAVATDAQAAAAPGGSVSAPTAGEGVSGPDTPEMLQALPLCLPHINLHGATAAAAAAPSQQPQQEQPQQQQHARGGAAARPAHVPWLQQQAPSSRNSLQRSSTPRDVKSKRRATLLMLEQHATAATTSTPDSTSGGTVQPATAAQQASVLDEFLAALGASQHTAALWAAGSRSHAARRRARLLMLPADTPPAAAGTATSVEEQAAGPSDKGAAQLQQQDVALDSAERALLSQLTDAAAAAHVSTQRAETTASEAASKHKEAHCIFNATVSAYVAGCAGAAAAPAAAPASEADACQDIHSRPAPTQQLVVDAAGPPVAAAPTSSTAQPRSRPGLTPLNRRKALLLQPAAQSGARTFAALQGPLQGDAAAPISSEEAAGQGCAAEQAATQCTTCNAGLWGARGRRLAQLLPPLHPAAGAAAACAASSHSSPVGSCAQEQQEQQEQEQEWQDSGIAPAAAIQPAGPPAQPQQSQQQPQQQPLLQASSPCEALHPANASEQEAAQEACQAGAASGAEGPAQQQQQQQQSADGTGAASTDGQHFPNPCIGQHQQPARLPSPKKHTGASARRRAALLGVAPAGMSGGPPGTWVDELLSVAAAEGCCHLAPRQAPHSCSAAGAPGAGGAKAKRRAQLLELPELAAAPPTAGPEATAAAVAAAAAVTDGGDGPAVPTAATAVSEQHQAQQHDSERAGAVSPPNVAEHKVSVTPAAAGDSPSSAPQSVSLAAVAAAAASEEVLSPGAASLMEGPGHSAEPRPALRVEPPSPAAEVVAGADVEVLSPVGFMHGSDTELAALVSSLLPETSDSGSEDGTQECADKDGAAEVDSDSSCPGNTPVKQQAQHQAQPSQGCTPPRPAPAADAPAAMEVDGDSGTSGEVSSADAASPPAAAASPPPPAAAAAGHNSSVDVHALSTQQLAEPAAGEAVSPADGVEAPAGAAADTDITAMEGDSSSVPCGAEVVAAGAAGSPSTASQPSGDLQEQPQQLQQAATPVVSAQQRVCLRQGSPSTPQLQFQLGLSLGSAEGAAAGHTRRLQQQQQVADLLQLAGAYAADTLRSSGSAGRDTATQLDQSAAAPAVAAVAAAAQGESPNTPDTLLAASQQQRLGLLQPGGSGSCGARHRTRPALGSVAQRRAALLMPPAGDAQAGAADTSTLPKGSDSSSVRSGEKLDAWLHFQATAGFGLTPAASPADVLRDQYQQAGAAVGPKQQQEPKCQNNGSSSGSTPLKVLSSSISPSAAGLARVSAAVQESPIPRYPGSGTGRSPTALVSGSPRPCAGPVVVQHFLSPAPASLRGVRRPSPPPAVAAGAAEATGDEGADVPPVQSPAPARYIPAAALVGVARTMVYVRLPGTKQSRKSKGSRQGSSSSSSHSTQAAAPFVSFPLAPGELPDGAGTCAVKETLEQAVRAAHLDLQLAQAAADGAPWAACDLSGLPLNTSAAQLQVYKDRYQGVRDRLMNCRHPTDVAKLEKQLAAEWAWLQDVRRGTTAAVSQCRKQGILRRKAAEADAMCERGWVADGIPMEPATGQQCRTGASAVARSGRVKFCLPESPDAAA